MAAPKRPLTMCGMVPSTMRDLDHFASGLFLRLLDARRDFIGFAVSPADLAVAVADHDHGGEAEAATTFDHCRTAFDLDNLVDVLATC